jgi:hypothetical protein
MENMSTFQLVILLFLTMAILPVFAHIVINNNVDNLRKNHVPKLYLSIDSIVDGFSIKGENLTYLYNQSFVKYSVGEFKAEVLLKSAKDKYIIASWDSNTACYPETPNEISFCDEDKAKLILSSDVDLYESEFGKAEAI